MKILKCRYLWFIIVAILPVVAFASDRTFGQIANTLFGSEVMIRGIIRAVCIIAGCALVLGSVLQYKKHRQNPLEVRLGSVFVSLFTGLALIALSFIPFQFQ